MPRGRIKGGLLTNTVKESTEAPNEARTQAALDAHASERGTMQDESQAMQAEPDEKSDDARTSLLFGFIPVVPLAFLGLGIYRAWIEIAFVGSFVDFPFGASARDLFDATMVVVSLVCAAFAKRIGPFFNKPGIYVPSGILLVASTVCVFAACMRPELAGLLAPIGALTGGVGIAFLILLWSELYGCLNPMRVASYYSLAIAAGAIVIYIYRGFAFPWLFVMTALLPLVSLLCARSGFDSLPKSERPSTVWVQLSVPWKAILLMATYAFAYGMLEMASYEGSFGPHSSPGTAVGALAVFFGVAARGKRFDFGLVYRVALPLTVAALLLLPSFNFMGGAASSFCVSAGYTMQSIIIMLIVANLCYRYGASAIWLFGIERGIRQIFMMLGRGVTDGAHALNLLGGNGEVFISIVSAIAVVAATMILMSEGELSSSWGVKMVRRSDGQNEPNEKAPEVSIAERKHELASRVAATARAYKLSAREEEVLLLLAQRKTVGIIERELFIANGTAKAHVRHIYQKLDIHTRQELFDMLGVETESPAEKS